MSLNMTWTTRWVRHSLRTLSFSLFLSLPPPSSFSRPAFLLAVFPLLPLTLFPHSFFSALYGHVPFMIGHSKNHTAGMFWMNAAEMWIDVHNKGNTGLLTRLLGNQVNEVETKWMAESGIAFS